MHSSSRIFVAGHRGLVGSAICRLLRDRGYSNIVTRTHADLELTDQAAVRLFFETAAPEYVFLAGARVGGILANATYPAEFLYQNLMIEANVVHAAWKTGVRKLLFLGSSCIYPRLAAQPIKEEYLLTGELEPTNEPYAIAKIAGLKMIQAYRSQYSFPGISCMPTNLYGPGDNFDPQTSHVLPALIRKLDDAVRNGERSLTLWGTGTPRREFLFVDDFADAAVFLMERYSDAEAINVGVGEDLTIADLARIVARVVGFAGEIRFDPSRPDGTPRKLLDITRLRQLGWAPHTPLEEGIRRTYNWYASHRLAVSSQAVSYA